jgi:hypothetical protein
MRDASTRQIRGAPMANQIKAHPIVEKCHQSVRRLAQVPPGDARASRHRSPAAVLPKTGIFQISAGDYRLFRAGNGQIRSLETSCQFAKARHRRAFLRLLRAKSPDAGLAGWGGRIRRRVRNRMLLPDREDLQNSIFSGIHQQVETLEFREQYRIPGVQSFGENWPFGEEWSGFAGLISGSQIRNRC